MRIETINLKTLGTNRETKGSNQCTSLSCAESHMTVALFCGGYSLGLFRFKGEGLCDWLAWLQACPLCLKSACYDKYNLSAFKKANSSHTAAQLQERVKSLRIPSSRGHLVASTPVH